MTGSRAASGARPGEVAAGRWEVGSEFPWIDLEPSPDDLADPWGDRGVLAGSGRDALKLLLRHGMECRGRTRVWIPSYFCDRVVEAIASTGIETLFYRDDPTAPAGEPPVERLMSSDSVLAVNYFGLRTAPDWGRVRAAGAEIIEDHTHDPWSPWAAASTADFAVAALRKVMPLPDGGVLWSPEGRPMPPPPPLTGAHSERASWRLAAMLTKELYLRGRVAAKEEYRTLQAKAEARLGTGEVSGPISVTGPLVGVFPRREWREAKRANFRRLAARLDAVPGVTVLRPGDEEACPFGGVVLLADAALRERVRRFLIGRGIYPAVLWPLDDSTPWAPGAGEIDLSQRILYLHCDRRYDGRDIDRVAEAVGEAVAARDGEAAR